jgi:hypothetical protein
MNGGSVTLDYRNLTKNMITNYGNYDIKSIKAIRTPIINVLNSLMNVITLGKFKQLQKEYGYDKLYHLAIVVTLNDTKDTSLVIEKNEKITITMFKPSMITNKTETVDVPMNYKKVSLYDLLNNARRSFGDYLFFSYDGTGRSGKTNNCQDFIMMLLTSSGLGNNESKNFIKQELDEMLQQLGSSFHRFTKGVTDKANELTSFIGLGYCDCDCHKH